MKCFGEGEWVQNVVLSVIRGWCSTGMEVEVGGERRLSEHSSAAMFCVLGLQVWKLFRWWSAGARDVGGVVSERLMSCGCGVRR